MTVLAGGTAFASVEEEPTAWDGIWWAMTTMTTVGYGDIYPQTDAGRVLAILVMVVGIGFGSVLIGAVAERFVAHGAPSAGERGIENGDGDLLDQLRDLGERLRRIETAVERCGRQP